MLINVFVGYILLAMLYDRLTGILVLKTEHDNTKSMEKKGHRPTHSLRP